MKFKDKYKSFTYIEKVTFYNKLSVAFNLSLFFGKASLAIYYKDILYIVSSFYSFFIVLAKLNFNEGIKKEDQKYKYYLYMSIFLMISSLIYIFYWILICFVLNRSLEVSTIKYIIYIVIFALEFVLSIKGLLISNKEKNLLLNGLKFVNLSIALSSLMMVIISLKDLLTHSKTVIVLNISGLIISIIMFIILGITYRKNKKKD